MKVLYLSNAPPDAKGRTTNRSPGGRRLIRLNRSERIRYLYKMLVGSACNQGWLRSFSVEREQDSFWLVAL